MASSYRFSDPNQDGTQMRSRVGLAGVTSGASSGGEGYRQSALRPGSGGYAAASFGAAPRTDYVKPAEATPEVPAAPTLAPAAAPPAQDNSWEAGRGGAGIEGGGSSAVGGPGGFDAGGKPGDLSGLIGDINIDGKTLGGWGGALLGGLLGGPLGALAGGVGGRALGSSFDGSNDGMASGAALDGLGAQAQANTDAMQGSGFGDARGLAEGGRVGPENLRGLGQVGMGGRVGMPHYMDGGPVDALAGPNPPGPDDGFAALDQGEFVVKHDQAQRPEYASVLDQINQGTYQPGQDDGMGGGEETMMTDGQMPAEGKSPESEPSALPPIMQQALASAMASDPMLAAALMTLLGPQGAHELTEMGAGGDMADPNETSEPDETDPSQNRRPPLAGPPPMPGMHAPPGVRPPDAATPTMPFPPPQQQQPMGLRGIAA